MERPKSVVTSASHGLPVGEPCYRFFCPPARTMVASAMPSGRPRQFFWRTIDMASYVEVMPPEGYLFCGGPVVSATHPVGYQQLMHADREVRMQHPRPIARFDLPEPSFTLTALPRSEGRAPFITELYCVGADPGSLFVNVGLIVQRFGPVRHAVAKLDVATGEFDDMGTLRYPFPDE